MGNRVAPRGAEPLSSPPILRCCARGPFREAVMLRLRIWSIASPWLVLAAGLAWSQNAVAQQQDRAPPGTRPRTTAPSRTANQPNTTSAAANQRGTRTARANPTPSTQSAPTAPDAQTRAERSEEHTPELQPRLH